MPCAVSGRRYVTDASSSTGPMKVLIISFNCFFFNDTATTEIYTLSLHDALPISPTPMPPRPRCGPTWNCSTHSGAVRSEEHTSELQSHLNLVCRLLLEKKKK